MSYFTQPVITNKAKEESLFALVNNQPLVFSRIGLGSGRLTANLEDLTNIQTPAHSIGVTGSLNSKENIRIVGRLDNRTITEELTVTEIGVFAKVGTRPEFLFMYTSAENGDIIPPSTVASMIRTYEFNTTISNDGELQVEYVAGDNLYANYEELVNVQNDLDDHATDASNPHQVSKSQVGLGNVENYGIATVGEAQAGSADNKLMTPSKTRDTVGNYPSATPAAKGLMSNTDKSKLDGIATGAQVNRAIASQQEGEAGINNTQVMTPLGTKQAITKQAMVVVNHGANASTARPAGAVAVYWIGSVEPSNATDNDLWIGG